MGLTDAMITADLSFIQSDLAATSATETVQRVPAGETDVSGSFDIVRAKQRTSEELQQTGFAKQYRFTFYAQTVHIGESTEGDVIIMANGDRVRIFRLTPQPAKLVTMFDVGDEFEDGVEFE